MKRVPALIAACLFTSAVQAQTFELVHTFGNPQGHAQGRLVQTVDGSFYGTTERGGRFGKGSIYRLDPAGAGAYTLVELHAFFGADGMAPRGGLIVASDGQFYGTTHGGGDSNLGTVYRMDHLGRVTTIHSFQISEGFQPQGELVEWSDGLLYGTTSSGGTSSGTIFRSDRSGNVTIWHDFSGADGALPNAGLTIGPDGALYGTTMAGGANNGGVIFRLESDGTTTNLHDLNADTDGFALFSALLLGSDGLLYGTAGGGGPNGTGTLFRISTTGEFTMLYGLSQTEGSTSVAPLFETSPGVFLGTASFGGTTGQGTVFRFETASSTLTRIYSFVGLDGEAPYSGLIRGADGLFYGTTTIGGPEGLGEVFRTDVNGALTIIAPFGNTEGMQPQAGLVEGDGGDLLGTAAAGGGRGVGTIFRLDALDGFHTVKSLVFEEAAYPVAPLVKGPDGFYGTASAGGSHFSGSVFRVKTDGQFDVLHSFDLTGFTPLAALVEGPDGLFYGTTSQGGEVPVLGQGTIFRVSSAGEFLKLWDFAGPEGAAPEAPLVIGSDGDFYGTASGGGTGNGSIYRYNTTDGATLVHAFDASEGKLPVAPLLEVTNGVFLGTASAGAAHLGGSIVRLDDAGLTVVHAFDEFAEGITPTSPLVLAPDGYHYGTTRDGGNTGAGTVFRLDDQGTVTTVHNFFALLDGAFPLGALLAASDGNLYGTTQQGLNGGGSVFRLLPNSPPPALATIDPSSGAASGGSSVRISGTHFRLQAGLVIGAAGANGFPEDSRSFLGVAPALAPGSLNDVTITNIDASTATLPNAWFADFLDVNSFHLFHDSVEAIVRAGITAGCGGGNYCVTALVTRAQMAVFLLKAMLGADHVPPPATGTVFLDVPQGSFAADWIEELASLGVTSGCGGGNYCPGASVTRAQMAVFLLKTSLGSGYVPPVVAEIFDDVPPGAFAADWINDLFNRGITGGCSASPLLYCPGNSSTRGQMAVFLTRTFLAP